MSEMAHSIADPKKLCIGEGVIIKGEIAVPETLVVGGQLEGDASVGNLVVTKTGTIKGNTIVAQNAEIAGKVYENLDVKGLLILRSGGRVDGRISYGMLQIEQGATIVGGLSSIEKRPEQKLTYSGQDQKPLKSGTSLGNSRARGSKVVDLSTLGSELIRPTK